MGRTFDCLALMSSTAFTTSTLFPALTVTSSSTASPFFTFVPSPLPATNLSFPLPPTPSSPQDHATSPLKRCRALTDIDGELSSPRKKKRRLRLFLITSRLSRPFSVPATNIVDRGSSKIAVWAKQKALGRNMLRKAAILNRIRRLQLTQTSAGCGSGDSDGEMEQEKQQEQFELARLAFLYGSHDTHTRPVLQRPPPFPPTAAVRIGNHFALSGSPNAVPFTTPVSAPIREAEEMDTSEEEASSYRSPNDPYSYPPPLAQAPRRDYIPLPPSPLGLSNYDALDLEDEIHDPYAAFDDDDDDHDDSARDGECDWSMRDLSPSASTTVSYGSTVCTSGSELRTPPPLRPYSDRNLHHLDPDEAVMGDYDDVDGEDGIDAVWPDLRDVPKQPYLPVSAQHQQGPGIRVRPPNELTERESESERQRGFMF